LEGRDKPVFKEKKPLTRSSVARAGVDSGHRGGYLRGDNRLVFSAAAGFTAGGVRISRRSGVSL
jgi:hypothetical protein